MLRTSELEYIYDSNTHLKFPDIHFGKGDHGLIIGRSGSGKSTLLHLIGGLRRIQKGSIQIGGTEISKLSETELDHYRGQHIGIIFQQAHFIKALTVSENLRLAQHLAGFNVDQERITMILDRLDIIDKSGKKPQHLSMGEQQRVSIARALINKPNILLADEPTSALDDKNCLKVLDLLETQAREDDITLIIVTHDNRLKTQFKQAVSLG
jgi:ABC-type lipoprotein export system ATPase subunit